MSNINVGRLISQVKANCDLSDAKSWGTYTVCGLLLRLRELFRSENGLNPWERISQKDLVEWISEKEDLWERLENKDFDIIVIGGHKFGPFEVEKINAVVKKEGIIYGAGYGAYMKPTFFLAELVSDEVIDEYEIYISGRELARDLSAYPAMLQDSTIYARKDVLSVMLWDKFEEMGCKKNGGALSYAFSNYSVYSEDQTSEDVYNKIQKITEKELETYIYHEIGEAFEGKRLGDEWKEMLIDIQNRRLEFFIRGIKDILSDTSEKGMLVQIIEKERKGSLGFYISFLGGFRKLIFPEILGAFQRFTQTEDWTIIDDARKAGYKKADELASKALDIYKIDNDKTRIKEIFEKELICKITP